MTSRKRTNLAPANAARTNALTAAWKKAFDGPIREAVLTRAQPATRGGKTRQTSAQRRRDADTAAT